MSYRDDTINKFVDKLSSSEPMPGGGVSAALVAANGVACVLKVCNLSNGKEKYKEHESLIKESINKLNELKNTFFDLMDKDAENFKEMEKVFKMPKETKEDKKKRKEALENACKICCDVPCILISSAAESMTIASALMGKSNVSAASDLKVGMILLYTSLTCAWENIEINLKYISDEEFKKPLLKMRQSINHLSEPIN